MEQFSAESLAEDGRGDNQRYFTNIFSLLDLLLVVLFKLALAPHFFEVTQIFATVSWNF